MEVCPYEARSYVENNPKDNAYWGHDFALTPYEEKKTVKLHDFGKVGKCNFCLERIERKKVPACVHTCITGCRMVGDIDDPRSEISLAILKWGAKPLHEEFGTKPSVYYIGSFTLVS
jgi:molybdopterin-containing oxidoreductase family iron-sulfur binding subunit